MPVKAAVRKMTKKDLAPMKWICLMMWIGLPGRRTIM